MKKKLQITAELIQSLLPSEPDGYLGYEVVEQSHMWFAVYLMHPPYTYKEGVRTIWGYVKRGTGVVYPPRHGKPDKTPKCSVLDMFKQNCYTLVYTKPSPLLKYL